MSRSSAIRTTLMLAVVAMMAASTATASPLISIGEGQPTSWNAALLAGNIQPATDPLGPTSGNLTDQATAFYTGEAGAGNFGQAEDITLTAVNPIIIEGEGHDSLEMSWNPWSGSDEPMDLSIAAWDYVYDIDPNLTGTKAHFSIGVPPKIDPLTGLPVIDPLTGLPMAAIWDISFELIDNMGRARSWFWPGPPVGWSMQWLMLDNPVAQGPFIAFGETPGFDITNVVAIRLDEAGMFVTFPAVPSGTPSVWDWNAWDHLMIMPEPNSLVLAGLGLVGLLAGRRRRRG